jgi:hypothetical protein
LRNAKEHIKQEERMINYYIKSTYMKNMRDLMNHINEKKNTHDDQQKTKRSTMFILVGQDYNNLD